MTALKKPPVYARPTYAVDFVPGNTRDEVFLGNAGFDASVHLNVVLGAEMWAAVRRLKIVDSLVAKKIMPTTARVEAYLPSADEEKAWAAERNQMIKEKFGPLVEMAKISPSFPAPKQT